MAVNEVYEAAGFLFPNQVQAQEALEEEKKVYYIRTRLRREDPGSILVVYNKLIRGNVLKTPVGLAFLKEVYNDLKDCPGIKHEEIEPIPYGASYLRTDVAKREETLEEKTEEIRSLKKKISFMGTLIAMLVVVIIAMFIITYRSDNPNILNYETALQNKYSAWEQDLRKRENDIRMKERDVLSP